MRRLTWIFQEGPKCDHKCPHKRKEKEDNADTQAKGHMETGQREV